MEKTSCANNGAPTPLLETLYTARTESGLLALAETRADFDRLYDLLDGSTLESVDKIICLVCQMCSKFERAGFFEGVKVGYQLEKELRS